MFHSMIVCTYALILGILLLNVSSAFDDTTTEKNRLPVLGFNTWNQFACNISETLIKELVDSVIDLGLDKFGYKYINVDDCWQASTRDSNGKIQSDPIRFPSGMKALGEYIHSKGLKFGIYSSAGFKTCEAFPASLGMEYNDVMSYVEFEVDYLKYDNCYTDKAPPNKRYKIMSEAIGRSGRNIYYNLCEWGVENPAAWAGEVANSWRISPDIRDGWPSILTRAAISAPLWRYASIDYGWNDPDMLEVGNGGCSDEEYRTHFALWAMLKAPLILGNDLRVLEIGNSIYNIISNKDIIAINQDSLGWQARRIWSDSRGKDDNYEGDSAEETTRLIATKCAAMKEVVLDSSTPLHQDDPMDQQWQFTNDGKIFSPSTGMCLVEDTVDESNDLEDSPEIEDYDQYLGMDNPSFNNLLRRSVRLGSCDEVSTTMWSVGTGTYGGQIQSKASGNCLEVLTSNKDRFLATGKKVLTRRCETGSLREHQSFVMPYGINGTIINLYQRSCITVDRDAPPGDLEAWVTPLANYDVAVLLINKDLVPRKISVPYSSINEGLKGLDESIYLQSDKTYMMKELWSGRIIKQGVAESIDQIVPKHGSKLLVITNS